MDIKKKIAALQSKFESSMTSASFAEAGEFDIAKDTMAPKRAVVLAANEKSLSAKVFSYADNVSRRTDAKLRLLFISNGKEPWDALEDCLIRLNSLFKIRRTIILKESPLTAKVLSESYKEVSLEVRKGCIRNQIIDYIEEHTGVLFVVLESKEGIEANCSRQGESIESSWESLGCPLVYVSELDSSPQ